jgi:hypothetical protein
MEKEIESQNLWFQFFNLFRLKKPLDSSCLIFSKKNSKKPSGSHEKINKESKI